MEKSTDELFDMLDKNKNIEKFLDNNTDEFLDMSAADYINDLINKKMLKKVDVVKKSGINNIYAYQILSGLKKPSRDKLIQLAFGMQLNLDETQRLLKIGGGSALYPRCKRDSVIIYSINNGKSVFDCDEILYELNEKTLQ